MNRSPRKIMSTKQCGCPAWGCRCWGARLKAAGYRVELYLGRGMSLPWSRIVDAGLVGISTTTATSSEAYRIAGYLRSRGLTVMIGGSMPILCPMRRWAMPITWCAEKLT